MHKKRRSIRKPSPPTLEQKRPRRKQPADPSVNQDATDELDELGRSSEQRRAIAGSWVRYHEKEYIGTPWTSDFEADIDAGQGHRRAHQKSRATAAIREILRGFCEMSPSESFTLLALSAP